MSKTLTAKKYQHATKEFAVYPKAFALEYLTLGLASEAGEAAGKVKKMIRGDYTEVEEVPEGETARMRVNIVEFEEDFHAELGDVLWYLSELCNTTGTTLEHLMAANIKKLKSRKEREALKGSGDNR